MICFQRLARKFSAAARRGAARAALAEIPPLAKRHYLTKVR